MNAFKVHWNYSEKFPNIVIHLGDFHYMKEFFAVIGKLTSGSGFEDIIFQHGTHSSGSLNGVISGSHYNRNWIVHALFSEALEPRGILFERLVTIIDQSSIPHIIKGLSEDRKANEKDLTNIALDSRVQFSQMHRPVFDVVMHSNKVTSP